MEQDSDGRRKDGKPYKPGNTREDGSYEVGRKRTPPATRFAAGDGRTRGRRPKGVKNLATDWAEELASCITITEAGRTVKRTKQRALIKATIARGMKTSDRAVETAFRYAPVQSEAAALSLPDDEIVARWLAQRDDQPQGDPELGSEEPSDDL